MHFKHPLALSLAFFASAGFAQFTPGFTQHSLTNGAPSWGGIDMFLENTSDVYLNSFSVVDTGGWNTGIDVGFNGSYFDNNSFTYGSYTMGSLIGAGQNWQFGGIFGGMLGLNLNTTVAEGTYTAEIQLRGGATDTSDDLLLSFLETVEVVNYNLDLSSPDTYIELAPGGSTTIRHHLVNNSANAFLVNSRSYSWSTVGRDQFDIQFSSGYPSQILPSEDLTVSHLDITALPTFTDSWSFTSEIIGGWYQDDANFIQISTHTLAPVPEPATLAVLGLGAAALIRRRRKG